MDTHGISIRVGDKTGVVAVDLWPWARPDRRDPAWLEKTEASFPSKQDFRREFMLDWTASAGSAFYPEFADRGEDLYVHTIRTLMDYPVRRGWDFGHRFPALVCSQYDPIVRRLVILRSIMPTRDQQIHVPSATLRDLGKYLCGQIGLEAIGLDAVAMEWLEYIEGQDVMPTPPWFAPGTEFIDYSGHEAVISRAEVAQDSAERNTAEIFEAGGIYLQPYYSTVKARETAMRDLLSVREDGWPGLIIDPSNWQLLEGMRGGISYPKASKAIPLPKKPKKDGYYDNIHDALGYVAVNVVKEEIGVEPAPSLMDGYRYQRPATYEVPVDGSLFHEARV
jgi:hypothetical protein